MIGIAIDHGREVIKLFNSPVEVLTDYCLAHPEFQYQD